jgi:hypothetical protein
MPSLRPVLCWISTERPTCASDPAGSRKTMQQRPLTGVRAGQGPFGTCGGCWVRTQRRQYRRFRDQGANSALWPAPVQVTRLSHRPLERSDRPRARSDLRPVPFAVACALHVETGGGLGVLAVDRPGLVRSTRSPRPALGPAARHRADGQRCPHPQDAESVAGPTQRPVPRSGRGRGRRSRGARRSR